MKMGQFEKSIEHYQKALAINPNFVASRLGIATNLNYLGQHAAARKQLQTLYDMARNDGERRAAYFALAVSYVDEGKLEQALAEFGKGYVLAEKINDAAALAGDLIIQGNILLEAGKCEPALKMFEKSVKLIQASNLSQEVKENSKRALLYNSARVAIMQQDLATARTKAEKFQQAVQAVNNPLQMFLYHELMGMIACAEKKYDAAIAEYNQANQQNPYILYRLALAYQGKGDTANCKTYSQRAAKFNALNNLNQAFIRTKAEKLPAQM
jgi:tetratricopeptide (TPR) repeat protein